MLKISKKNIIGFCSKEENVYLFIFKNLIKGTS